MNKKLSTSIKDKNNQILSLQDENKHLKKVNKNDKLDEMHNLKEQLEEATRNLTNRDNDFKFIMTIKLQGATSCSCEENSC